MADGPETFTETNMETLGDNFGYFHSLKEAYTFIMELETQSTTKFACYKADKSFGAIGENGSFGL